VLLHLKWPRVALLSLPAAHFGGRGPVFAGLPVRLDLNRGQSNAGSPRPAR